MHICRHICSDYMSNYDAISLKEQMPYCKPENVQNNSNGSIEKIQSKSIPPYKKKNENKRQLFTINNYSLIKFIRSINSSHDEALSG